MKSTLPKGIDWPVVFAGPGGLKGDSELAALHGVTRQSVAAARWHHTRKRSPVRHGGVRPGAGKRRRP